MENNLMTQHIVNQKTTLAIIACLTFLGTLNPTWAAEINKQKWVQEYEKACERGSVQECFNLAVGYLRGDVAGKKITKDPLLAKQYTDRAIDVATQGCRQANLKACYLLGLAYFEGQFPGVPSDYPKGLDYTRKACNGGYKEACEWLRNSGV